MTIKNIGTTDVFVPLIEESLFLVHQDLGGFWDNQAQLSVAFGNNYDQEVTNQLFTAFSLGDFSEIPKIKVLSDELLGAANGAYSTSQNQIYLKSVMLSYVSSSKIMFITKL